MRRCKLSWVAFFVVFFLLLEILSLFYDGESLSDLSYAKPSWTHFLGTNLNGQDIFARLVLAIKNSFWNNFLTSLLCVALGIFLNLVLFLFNFSHLKKTLLFLAHLLDTLPIHFIISCCYSLIRAFPEGFQFFLVVSVCLIPFQSILRKQETLEKHQLILSAKQIGCTQLYIFCRYLFPQFKNLLVAEINFLLLKFIKLEIGLSFIGLKQSYKPTLGLLFAESSTDMLKGEYTTLLATSVVLFLILFFFNTSSKKLFSENMC